MLLGRRHHRAETHSTWRYLVIDLVMILLNQPNGHLFHVGPAGPVRSTATDHPAHTPSAGRGHRHVTAQNRTHQDELAPNPGR